jgi:hypothetical protein
MSTEADVIMRSCDLAGRLDAVVMVKIKQVIKERKCQGDLREL